MLSRLVLLREELSVQLHLVECRHVLPMDDLELGGLELSELSAREIAAQLSHRAEVSLLKLASRDSTMEGKLAPLVKR